MRSLSSVEVLVFFCCVFRFVLQEKCKAPFDKVTEGILFLVRHLLLTLSRNRPRCAVCRCAVFDSAVVISGKPCRSVLQAKRIGTTSSSYSTVIGISACIQEVSHIFTVGKTRQCLVRDIQYIIHVVSIVCKITISNQITHSCLSGSSPLSLIFFSSPVLPPLSTCLSCHSAHR